MAVSHPFLSLNQVDCKNNLPEILTCPSFSLQRVPIISRPPQSPYDILIIDAGSDNEVKAGMLVTAYGNVLLGYVAEVFPSTSKVKLISFSNEETNVLIESAGTGTSTAISAIAVGRGGENLEIKLPSSIAINSGDQVKTMGNFPFIAGTIEKVEISLSDPFQKLFFRLPVNIQELKYVMIEKI
jgi:cell shape-determining protein MreC